MLDNGPGINKADRHKLFKPFSKIDSNKSLNPNGNGLGLSICKVICNGLGGDIVIDAQSDKWTQFTFWIQIKEIKELINEYDIEPDTSRHPAEIGIKMQEMQEVRTKEKVTKAFIKTQVQTPFAQGGLQGSSALTILCVDDQYFNLEALRVVFK